MYYPGQIFESFNLRFEGWWESGHYCWTDLLTGGSFSTQADTVYEVLGTMVAVRNSFESKTTVTAPVFEPDCKQELLRLSEIAGEC